MRRTVLLTGAAVLLVGPTVLAFFSGGYFDGPRLIATLVAWALVLVAAVASPWPAPRSWQGWAAVAGLAAVAAWTAASLAWAPLSEPATANLVRLLLYLGVLLAAMALLRERPASDAVEPMLALGAVVVIGYGLAGRLLPGVVHIGASAKAFGRLEQPITYWNAEGALAAIGLVLCARIAGSEARPAPMRVAAAAACAPLGMGVYLTLSRGAIVAAVVGMIVLIAAAPSWAQLRAGCTALASSLAAAAAAAPFEGVASLEGGMGAREREGAIVLAVLAATMVAAGIAQARFARAERSGPARAGRLAIAPRLPRLAGAAVVLALAGLAVGGLYEVGNSSQRGASRLTSVGSQRHDYWEVGLRAFARHPLEGLGSGGFRVEWLRERPVPEAALEVHSLPLEMAAELGIVGLLGFAAFLVPAGLAGAGAVRRGAALAPGACAAATVWCVHAAIDWDWQIPAVTLPAIVMAGALIAASEADAPERPPAPVSASRAGSAA